MVDFLEASQAVLVVRIDDSNEIGTFVTRTISCSRLVFFYFCGFGCKDRNSFSFSLNYTERFSKVISLPSA